MSAEDQREQRVPILGRIEPPIRLVFKSTLTGAKSWVLNQAAKG